MILTPSTLTRASAVAVVISGLIYVAIQFAHPAETATALTTPAWAIVHTFSFAMAVLGLIGITGIYLLQARTSGVLGLLGYAMFGLFFILQAAFTFAEAFVAPLLAEAAPELAEDFVGLFSGHVAQTDLGALAALPPVGAALYIGGALLLGIAIVRARVLSRGAGILLIVAAAATPVASALLPHSLERMAAIPMGVALIWLGISLWRSQRKTGATDASILGESSLVRTASA